MPLVRIDLAKGKSAQFRKTLGDIVYKAMTDVINVPADDKFQVITEHPREELNYAPSYLGIEHSAGIVLIQITLSVGRPVERKQAFYAVLLEGAGNDMIPSLLSMMNARISLLRRVSLGHTKRLAGSIKEIRAILKAVKERNPAATAEACRIHVERAADAALAHMSNPKDPRPA